MLHLLDHDLAPLERLHIFLVRRAHRSPSGGALLRLLQRQLMVRFVNHAARRVLDVGGDERIPAIDPTSSVIVACNHHSPFDLAVTTSWLVAARRLRHRLMFPVRSDLIYGSGLGLAANGVTGLSLYPPLFNVPRRAALNLAALEESIRMINHEPVVLGLHPEGTHRSGVDPYELSPGQSGMGRILFHARAMVIPVFIRGLDDDVSAQVVGGLTGTAPPVLVVFGEPVELDDLRGRTPGPALYREVAQRTVNEIAQLGVEERGRRVARGLLRDTMPPKSGEQPRTGFRAQEPRKAAAVLRIAR